MTHLTKKKEKLPVCLIASSSNESTYGAIPYVIMKEHFVLAGENLLATLLRGNIAQKKIQSPDVNVKSHITFFSTQIISAFITFN